MELAREKNVRVLCIDDWSKISATIKDVKRRNHVMAETINHSYMSSSVLVVGGYHTEGLFALQRMVRPAITIHERPNW